MANEVTSFEVQGNEYDVNPHLTFDSTPTVGSSNPVTSNGIALAVQGAAVGTDISVGRTAGTPVGYCSIAYGTDNIASRDYGIVFGKNNIAASYGCIISGINNTVTYDWGNAVFGQNNTLSGYACLVAGYSNKVGIVLKYITDTSYPDYDHGDGQVYIGYVNPSTNKIYYDEEMTTEIPIDRRGTNDTFYFVDKRTYNNQNPGDVYSYERNTAQQGIVYIARKLKQEYVDFTNYCRSIKYLYKGPCYYSAANDKIYSDAAMENEITPSVSYNPSLYFDILDGSFIKYDSGRGNYKIPGTPKFLRVKVYRYNGPMVTAVGYTSYWGIRAYVDATINNYHVYTSSDYSPETDITDRLLDGEVIFDVSRSTYYLYNFDINNRLYRATVFNGGEPSFNQYNTHSIVFGEGNALAHSSTTMVIGNNNNVASWASEAGLIFGKGNHLIGCQRAHGLQFISGYNNSIIMPGMGMRNLSIIGNENTYSQSLLNTYTFDFGSIIGLNNGIDGYFNDNSQIYGHYNLISDGSYSTIIGRQNTLRFENEANILGSFNEINKYTYVHPYDPVETQIADATWLSDGRIRIGNEIYDLPINPSSSKNYPINQIFRVHGRVRPSDNEYNSIAYNVGTTLGYSYSPNGRELVDIPRNNWTTNSSISILGYHNRYVRNFDGFAGWDDDRANYYNYIIGAYNVIYPSGTKCVGLIGYDLIFKGTAGHPAKTPPGTIIMGAYNSDESTDGYTWGAAPQLIVGIGTSDNDRKNGFVVMKNGVLIAPECPNTMSEAIPYTDTRKMVMTFGLVMDYVKNLSPGTAGKPGQVVVTLNAADWSNGEQTIDFSGVDDNSVVIINPSGSPDLFYTDRIYLKSQGDGELTFGCLFAPAENVDVKVVYWT